MFPLEWLLFVHCLEFWSIQNVSDHRLLFHQTYLLEFHVYYLIAAETVQELRYCLQNAIDAMRSTENPVTAIASGSELFLRFITLATLDTPVRVFKNLRCIENALPDLRFVIQYFGVFVISLLQNVKGSCYTGERCFTKS